MIQMLCGCQSPICQRAVEIEPEDAFRLRKQGVVIIATACAHGPEPSDELLEQRDEYSLYREHRLPPATRGETSLA